MVAIPNLRSLQKRCLYCTVFEDKDFVMGDPIRMSLCLVSCLLGGWKQGTGSGRLAYWLMILQNLVVVFWLCSCID